MTPAAGAASPASAFVDALPVEGASVCVITASGIVSTVASSDRVAARLDSAQVQLEEGPRWRAFRTGEPVLVPDVRAAGVLAEWPLFTVAVGAIAVRAVFSFPLVHGLAVVGVADLYSSAPQPAWSDRLVRTGVALAAAAALPAVRLAAGSAEAERATVPGGAGELRREVQQAVGMLVVQLAVGPSEALAHLEARAFLKHRAILSVARDVVARRVDFRDPEG